jgi:hypothetical protein
MDWESAPVRPEELQRFGLSGNKNLPVLLRVDTNGAIFGVTHE